MFKHLLTFALLLTNSFFAIAQNDFRPGKVYLNNGDTLSGEINYNSRSSMSVQARLENSKDLKTYTVADLTGYEIEGILFLKRTVNVDQVHHNSPVFLETLVPGRAALLSFKTSANKAYYFLEKNDTLHYLRGGIIRVYQDSKYYHKEIRDYYGLLKFHTRDCEKLKNNFPNFKFTQEALEEIVTTYNSCFDEKPSAIDYKMENSFKSRKLFGLKAGATMPVFIVNGSTDFYSPKITPILGGFYIIPFGGSNKHLSAVFEITYSQRQAIPTQAGKEKRYNVVDFSLWEFHPMLRYTTARGIIRPMIGAGGYCSLASKNNFVIAREKITNFLIGLQAETGISIPVNKHAVFLTIRAQRTYYTETIKSWNYTLSTGFGF